MQYVHNLYKHQLNIILIKQLSLERYRVSYPIHLHVWDISISEFESKIYESFRLIYIRNMVFVPFEMFKLLKLLQMST